MQARREGTEHREPGKRGPQGPSTPSPGSFRSPVIFAIPGTGGADVATMRSFQLDG